MVELVVIFVMMRLMLRSEVDVMKKSRRTNADVGHDDCTFNTNVNHNDYIWQQILNIICDGSKCTRRDVVLISYDRTIIICVRCNRK